MPSSPEKHAQYMRDVWYPKNKEKHKKLVNRNNVKTKQERQQLVDKLKDVPCKDCGNKFPPCAMDFDHVRGTKLIDVAAAVSRGWAEKRILEEIAKCEIVCANCHRIRTYGAGGRLDLKKTHNLH